MNGHGLKLVNEIWPDALKKAFAWFEKMISWKTEGGDKGSKNRVARPFQLDKRLKEKRATLQ